MAQFQRKAVPFLHNGMNWNTPIEKLQDGQILFGKNIRVLEQGSISTAHGYEQAFAVQNRFYNGQSNTLNYVHSMSRLNILSQRTVTDPAAGVNGFAFDPALARTFIMVSDDRLYVFQDQTTLSNQTLNPVITPVVQADQTTEFSSFSNNPVTMVDMQPVGAAVAWKYIGDSRQMATVGYYPGGPDSLGNQHPPDQYDVNMARALTIGLDPPVTPQNPPSIAGAGNLNGAYQWAFVYRRLQTGARSNPSAATRQSAATPTLTLNNQAATMQVPLAPVDPQTGQPDLFTVVDIYRFGGNVNRWALVGTSPGQPGNDTFSDNISDLALLAAPSPSQITDASTGLTRFNLYRPFVTQDIQRGGQATASQPGAGGVMTLNVVDENAFNPEWLQGSTIYVGGAAFTIYQVRSKTQLELAGDVTGAINSGDTVTWSTPSGTLQAGQPLPHLWGPYGIGQSGSYIFACGDPNARGTLYWTNGNDPDSTDVVNNIIVTSPSEKLMTGCVYDGQPYVWSTERQFAIYPSVTIFGQFTTQEVAGAKGVWLEWSLSVQSNGVSDQSVTWRGKDGIYDFSSGGGLTRLSDPLYPFFPHDGSPPIAPETLFGIIGPEAENPEVIGNLDDNEQKYHRLTWFHGLLFYDFPALAGNPQFESWSTLVYDTVNIPNGGWVCVDQPFNDTRAPVARMVEIGANDPLTADNSPGPTYGAMARGGNMMVMRGGEAATLWNAYVFNYFGFTRNGFECRLITRAEDLGDSRAQKRWGDFWLDCTPLDDFTVYPLCGFSRFSMQPIRVSDAPITPDFSPTPNVPGSRAQFIMDFAEFAHNDEGGALMSPTLGLDIIWTAIDGQFPATLNQWQPSYMLKPEVISLRVSDPDDLGQLQAKYFTGFNLEANTFGQTYPLGVILDQQQIASLPITHNNQSELPYAFTPAVGYEAQIGMLETGGVPPTWQFYKINWIFEVWPDATTRASFPTDLGYAGSKFLQGMVVPMETGGQPVTFQVNGDCNQSATMGPVSTPDLCKMDLAFSFGPCNGTPSDPFIASSVQVVPNGAARIWYDQIRWIWEPEPELVSTWVTQPTDLDLPGWHSQRDCYIAYRGGSGAPTLYVTTEYGTEAYPLDPVTANQYVRCYRVLKPQKAKWRSFRVESCGLFRLYIKDCEVRAKAWGEDGPYRSFQPFGDLSRSNGGARI